MLTRNSPMKRFEYIAKQYGERDPGVVLDTFMLLADTAGIEHPGQRFVFASIWDAPIANLERRARWTQDVWDRGYVVLDRGYVTLVQRLRRRSVLVSRAVEKYIGIRPGRVPPGEVRVPVSSLLDLARVELADTPEMHRGREADALWPWVARNLVRLKRHDEPLSYEHTLHVWRGKAPAVAQWQRDNRIDLGRYTLAEALLATQDYAEELRRREIPDPGELVYEFDDGWTVEKLDQEDLLEQEGRVMIHCVGNPEYWEAVEAGDAEIYSLRDDEGRPHVTIELRPRVMRSIQEMGPENSTPPDEHLERVREWADAHGVKPDAELAPDEQLVAHAFGRLIAQLCYDELPDSRVPVSIVDMPDDPPLDCVEQITFDVIYGGAPGFAGRPPSLRAAFPGVSNWDWEDANLESYFEEAAEEGLRSRWHELVEQARARLGEVEERLIDEAEDAAPEFYTPSEYVDDALAEWAGEKLGFYGGEDVSYLVRRVELEAGHFWEDETG
ncbi:MAG TPA: PcfJ domain-containing protein [Myxococcota bacterium]